MTFIIEVNKSRANEQPLQLRRHVLDSEVHRRTWRSWSPRNAVTRKRWWPTQRHKGGLSPLWTAYPCLNTFESAWNSLISFPKMRALHKDWQLRNKVHLFASLGTTVGNVLIFWISCHSPPPDHVSQAPQAGSGVISVTNAGCEVYYNSL